VTAPSWLAFEVLGVTLLATVAVLAGVNRVAARARWSDRDRLTATRAAVLALATWFVAAVVLSAIGFYTTTDVQVPRLPLALLPAVFGGVFLARSKTLARLLEAAPQSWLVGVQAYRVVGVSFLVLWVSGYLPAVFALPAGLGDVTVGLLAVIVSRVASQRRAAPAWLVGAWNVLGLVDFTAAFATGFLSVPTPVHPVAPDHSSVLITMFPLALIPTYLVPLSILLHVASLTKLARERSSRRPGDEPFHVAGPAAG
jgi:hypothetical protein